MPDEVREVEHHSAVVAHKPGEAARVLAALREAGVNLIAFWGYPYRGRARLEFIPENGAAFVAAAKRTKLKLSKDHPAFYVQGEDRPGAIADILGKLAAARINVQAVQAVCGGAGRYGAIIYLTPAAARKAKGLFRA